jgi:hypothetical protein
MEGDLDEVKALIDQEADVELSLMGGGGNNS